MTFSFGKIDPFSKTRLIAPFVKLDYVRACTAGFGKPTVTEIVDAACQALKRQSDQREAFSLKNPVVFVHRFPGVEGEENFEKIQTALLRQGCEVIPCPALPRDANGIISSTVDVILAAETVARVVEHLQNPQHADVIPMLFLGENKWAGLVRVLSRFNDVEPWIVGSNDSIGADLRDAAQGKILLFENILMQTAESAMDRTTNGRPRVSFRRG